jgi:RNA polymerase sigma-70 factor (ECF subfamily)
MNDTHRNPDHSEPESSEEEVAELTLRLNDGDTEALARLFSISWQRLHRMVHFRLDPRLRGRVDSDDILQEAYLAARQRIDSFAAEKSNSVFVWLRLIVGQTMIDVHRRHLGSKMRDANQEVSLQRFAAPMASSVSMSMHLLGALTSPSQAAMKAEVAGLLDQILADMEPIDREVLVLRHFEELTNKEVSELLGIQRSTASNRYVRALHKLKVILTRIHGVADDEPPAPDRRGG